MSIVFDLAQTFVSLGADGRTVPMEVNERFWSDLEAGQIGAGPGRLLSLFAFDASWDVWEMHPHGDEIVLLLEGAAEMTLERPNGELEAVRLDTAGAYVLIERGTWHTARTDRPTRMLFVTDGEGTEHRPVEP
jgi:mannose-6-phosphate isomerase-like protein (cupin superfamily)